jgi:hypothetical protein
MTRFGGVFNYEEIVDQGFNQSYIKNDILAPATKTGDRVVVAMLNGSNRHGVILGGIKHAARSLALKSSDGPQYRSCFNGIETDINKDGEMTVTFNGIPTNRNILNEPSTGGTVPPPIYNSSIKGSYYKFDKTGSWILSDETIQKQSIHVDKKNGLINIVSGDINLTFDKNNKLVSLSTDKTIIKSNTSIEESTANYRLSASVSAVIKSPKVAIGNESVELLDTLCKLIDAIGALKIMSPVGVCPPCLSGIGWTSVQDMKRKISSIKGSL